MRRKILACVLSACLGAVTTQGYADQQQAGVIEEISVIGVRERLYQAGMLKDVIQKTEVISSLAIERANAASLTQAIAEAPGVRVNNECSMCGVKRVMLNGLRGEHTTILVDGVPTYTMMSGFYGLDAAAAAGIERIEIARGAGASLIAPEAIGGTINLITRTARDNNVEMELAGGEDGYRKASLVATGLSASEATRATFIAQYDNRDAVDVDDNGVSENPKLENSSLTLRLSRDFGDRDNLVVRLNHTASEIFGGPTGSDIGAVKATYFADPDFESARLFIDDDVRNDYIGRNWETAEWIESTRREVTATWLHEFSGKLNMSLTAARNEHEQDSFYEGFIYFADNDMTYLDTRFNWAVNDDHLLTFGIDSRREALRSTTNSTEPAYISDSFDYDTRGLYLQDTWTITERLQVSTALRFDRVQADFTDPQKPGTEIDREILSPRIDMRFSHNDTWTSRFSAGRGYRAPLSFFESDHGILDGDLGFDIRIDELERSHSANYALSYEGDRLSATGSLAYTRVQHLAALGESETGVPVLEQMDDEASATVADLALSYQLNDDLSVAATLENIDYNDTFKQSYGVVPVTKRLVLSTDWDVDGWDLLVSATWVGNRDLSEYGTPAAAAFDASGTALKSQKAESYWTLDMRLAKEVDEHWRVYAGATNLLDYTQVGDMETPLFYEGGAYDVAHIYGPLRGREIYAGVSYSF